MRNDDDCEGTIRFSRRGILKTSAYLTLAGLPSFASGQAVSDNRLLVILLRGGLDGLFAMPPVGDNDFRRIRDRLEPTGTLRLDGFFALHPVWRNVHRMYESNEALLVHATSIPYVGRSHFEGQNMMETGVMTPYASKTGWLGRALDQQGFETLGMKMSTPLILRGPVRSNSHYPSWFNTVGKPVYEHMISRYRSDPVLADQADNLEASLPIMTLPSGIFPGQRHSLDGLAEKAADELRDENGPRIAVLDHVGFDHHANEDGDGPKRMAEVDTAIGAFRDRIGDEAWKKTLVVTVTEFGRTVGENGQNGTDHGYGTTVFVLGGLLKQGGIVADWPGLKKSSLFEERDLLATLDARSLYGAIMSRTLEMDPDLIRARVLEHEPTGTFDKYLA